jgi:Phospholipase_D-nuclease N-terminal
MLGMFFMGGWVLLAVLITGLIMLGLLSFVFWIWMLIDSIKNESISSNEKVAWVLAIVLTHWLGALIYFFAGRPKRRSPAFPAMA